MEHQVTKTAQSLAAEAIQKGATEQEEALSRLREDLKAETVLFEREKERNEREHEREMSALTSQLTATEARLTAQFNAAKVQLTATEAQLTAANLRIDDLESEKNKNKSLITDYENVENEKLYDLLKTIDRQTEEIDESSRAIKGLEQQKDSYEKELDNVRRGLVTQVAEVEGLESREKEVMARLEGVLVEKEVLEIDLVVANNEIKTLHDVRTKLNNETDALNNEIKTLNNERKTLNNEVETLLQEMRSLESSNTQYTNDINDLKNEMKNVKNEISTTLNAHNQILAEIESSKKRLSEDLKDATNECENYKLKLGVELDEKNRLLQVIDGMSAMHASELEVINNDLSQAREHNVGFLLAVSSTHDDTLRNRCDSYEKQLAEMRGDCLSQLRSHSASHVIEFAVVTEAHAAAIEALRIESENKLENAFDEHAKEVEVLKVALAVEYQEVRFCSIHLLLNDPIICTHHFPPPFPSILSVISLYSPSILPIISLLSPYIPPTISLPAISLYSLIITQFLSPMVPYVSESPHPESLEKTLAEGETRLLLLLSPRVFSLFPPPSPLFSPSV